MKRERWDRAAQDCLNLPNKTVPRLLATFMLLFQWIVPCTLSLTLAGYRCGKARDKPRHLCFGVCGPLRSFEPRQAYICFVSTEDMCCGARPAQGIDVSGRSCCGASIPPPFVPLPHNAGLGHCRSLSSLPITPSS